MKPSEKLIVRLREELSLRIPATAVLIRTRAGYLQRSAGAWSWFLIDSVTGGELAIGSQWPVKALLSAPTLVVHDDDDDISIFPQSKK